MILEDQGNPLRRCAITRNRRPRELLLRFVADAQGKLTEDLAGRLPGRGVYVMPDKKRVTALLTRHKMAREEIDLVLARLEQNLARRLMDGVGLSRRTGGCRVGLREVEELLKQGHSPLLLLAADAGSVREKLHHLIHAGNVENLPEILEILDREQLSALWGGRGVTLAAVTHPGVGQRIRVDATRWRSFVYTVETTEEKTEKKGKDDHHSHGRKKRCL